MVGSMQSPAAARCQPDPPLSQATLVRSSTVDDTAGARTARTAPLRRDVDTAVWRGGAGIGVGPVANPATDGTAERRETRKASVSTALACDGMNRMKKARRVTQATQPVSGRP